MEAGKLYIVPTPVGNLGDMTPRAIEVLKAVDTILAEDTRTSGVLLKHYGISTPMRSHHKFNEHEAVAAVADQLQGGAVMALISDAGTPGISDPGFMLSRECRRRGIEVETLPGATAFVPALVNSGLPCDRFVFEGFLPQKKGRASRLEELKSQPLTMVFYESPTMARWVSWWTTSRPTSLAARSLSLLRAVRPSRPSRWTSMPPSRAKRPAYEPKKRK